MGLPRQGGQLDPEARASVARAAYLKAPEFSDEKALAKIDYARSVEQVLRREVVCGSNACAIDACLLTALCFVTLDASHAQDKQETATMELRKAGVTWGTAGFMGTLLVALLVKATGLMAY